MKKIKKKVSQKKTRSRPAFVVGYSQTEAPPPGYLAAWFNQLYGGPLQIHLTGELGHTTFEALHTAWQVRVNMALPHDTSELWKQRLAWSHQQVAEINPLPLPGQDKRDVVLHTARIARGVALLTEGTAYDVVSHSFLNPSDWHDRRLNQFHMTDHIRVEQRELIDSCQTWFFTLGLAKFGMEEIETFRPLGLPDQPVIEMLLEVGGLLLTTSQAAKVGAQLNVPEWGQTVTVVRHRTDQSTGQVLQLREIKCE